MSAAAHLTSVDANDLAEVEALLEAFRARSPSANARFFDRYQSQVNALVWSLLGADADHDDVVHAAFESMLKAVAKVRSAHALRGWVRTVTINAVRIELRRRRWRRRFGVDDQATLEHPDLQAGDAEQRDRARDLYRALTGLDAEARMAVVLRHVEGYELTEVAAVMKCSLATIKRRLEKAESRLGVLLGETR